MSHDLVRDYLKTIGKVPLLTRSEEQQLAQQIQVMQSLSAIPEDQQTHEQRELIRVGNRAKQAMIKANLRLVVSIAKHYAYRGLDMMDLVQEGSLGLTRATEKFDPTRGYKFSTYAYWWIRQTISRAIATQSRSICLPTSIVERLNCLRKTYRSLSQTLKRQPTQQEIADAMEIDRKAFEELLVYSHHVASLDQLVGFEEDTSLGDLLADDVAPLEEQVEERIFNQQLKDLLYCLTPRERAVIQTRYGLEDGNPLNRAATARKLGGLSRERVRQLETSGLRKLKAALARHNPLKKARAS
jgi:RNA polymerase sigma factor (sigma-70 family)